MALVQIQETPTWKKVLSYLGPGLLVSVAYLDPGNLQTDLEAGAHHKFELLWIVLVGLTFALIIQSRSVNLGVATGKHLSEHCRDEYPKLLNHGLWILAELAVIAADIPEVIGTAFAMNLLFKIPMWAGVVLAGLSTLVLLGVQKYGIRKLELLITILILAIGGCFFAEMARVKPDATEVIKGMFVPKISTKEAAKDAVALLGALIMPHNLFLHSALVISRKIPQSYSGISAACKNFLVESAVALLIAFLINVAVITVSGSICHSKDISLQDEANCDDITLNSAAVLLKNVLGKGSSKLYAVALLASGQSSTITGTYAGQYIMQGFLKLKMKTWLRNLMTRSIAIVPSLIVTIIGGSSAAGKLIVIASMILSFELPFALIPLLKFTSSIAKMGDHKNSLTVSIISWLLGGCLIGINTYVLTTTLMDLSTHSTKLGYIFATAATLSLMLIYLGALTYLTLRKGNLCTLPQAMNSTSAVGPPNNGNRNTNATDNIVADIIA